MLVLWGGFGKLFKIALEPFLRRCLSYFGVENYQIESKKLKENMIPVSTFYLDEIAKKDGFEEVFNEGMNFEFGIRQFLHWSQKQSEPWFA